MAAPLRIVVSGMGRHSSRAVLPAIAASRRWQLAGVVSARPIAASNAAAAAGVEGYGSLGEAIAVQRPDAVYISTVPARHSGESLEAIAARVPTVISEKPLAVDSAAVSELLTAADDADALLLEALAYQFHPQFAAVLRSLEADLGGLRHAYMRFSYPDLPEGDHRYSAAAGGGAFLDAGVYPISMAVRLLQTRDLQVVANRFFGEQSVDISGTATVTAADGRSIQCSWEIGSSYANVARLVGLMGTLEIPRPFSKPVDYDEPIQLVGMRGERTPLRYESADHFALMLEAVALRRDQGDWVASVHREIADRWSVFERVLAAR